MITDNNLEKKPISQLELFFFEEYFNFFKKLYEKKILPNAILLTGMKGIGKSTFAFHFINYLLSQKEKDSYLIDKFVINENNLSYKLMCENLHPNFFLLESVKGKYIEVDKVREVNGFLSKSSYLNDIKIILVNNSHLFNASSANALLKSIEEPSINTFFILIKDTSRPLISTLKSRCTEFKIFFDLQQKKEILKLLVKQNNIKDFDFNLFFETFSDTSPGNLINYLAAKLEHDNLDKFDIYNDILLFIDIYTKKKNVFFLQIIYLLIESFYNNKYLQNSNNISFYLNKKKIVKKLHEMQIYNLDEKNVFFEVKNLLNNG